MRELMVVAAGGAIGASLRYSLSLAFEQFDQLGSEWGTFTANILGSLMLGLLAGYAASKQIGTTNAIWLFLGVGCLGSFTTFSAFSRDVVNLLITRDALTAAALVLLSVAGSLIAFGAGFSITKSAL